MRNIVSTVLDYWSYIFRLILVVRPLPSSDSAPSNPTPSLQPHFTFPSHLPFLQPHSTSSLTPLLFLQPHPLTPLSSSNHNLSHPSLPPTQPSHPPTTPSNPTLFTPLSSPTPPAHTPRFPYPALSHPFSSSNHTL